ncbi:MAG: AAA family ATPase, partial [Thermodesulfobacteriaceae bacterium]|nr:AAA family ATPase [Thermodesulfobacteriaceae bacterium]
LKDKDLSAIREWYNGYSFLGEPVYNPFDILLYLSEGQFRPFWFETGTPSFLVRLLIKKRFFLPQLEELIATESLLERFDVDTISPEALLFQTGYLTVKRYEPSLRGLTYYLSYPNREVKIALNESLASFYIGEEVGITSQLGERLVKDLSVGQVEGMEKVLRSLFASIPYEWY